MENTTVLEETIAMKMRKLLVRLSLLILVAGCSVTNKYDSYKGKVIDAETKQPIEGAAVLVVYKTEQYGLAGPLAQFADAQETLTNKNGEFSIPAIRIFKVRVMSGWERYPHFTIFKPGYGCYPNHKDAEPMFIPNGTLPSNEFITIELPDVKNESHEERIRNAACLPSPNVPDSTYKQLFNLLQQERRALGLEREKEPIRRKL